MSSWVKLSRKLATSAIAAKPEYLAVWVHLLMAASYKEGEFLVGRQVVRLLPGQLVFGRQKFSEKTGVSEGIVRSALKVLESLQQITIKSESKFSVITVTKWAYYQSSEPANNQQLTSKRPAVDHNKEVLELQEDLKTLSLDAPLEGELLNDQRSKPRTLERNSINYGEIQQAYNETCGHVLPRCIAMTEKRKTKVKSMAALDIEGVKPFKDLGIDFWVAYFNDALQDPHKRGENDRGWKADFDFLTNPANALKILEKNNAA